MTFCLPPRMPYPADVPYSVCGMNIDGLTTMDLSLLALVAYVGDGEDQVRIG